MDNFYFVVLGIVAAWLAIATAVYAVLYRWFGSKIEKAWKRRTFLIGWSGVAGPGAFLGHGIAPLPPGVVVLMTLPNPNRTDQAPVGLVINLVLWAITAVVFYFVSRFLSQRKIGV